MYRNVINGFDRIVRMVPVGTLPDRVICEFDGSKNMLRIDEGYFNQASETQRRELWRSKSTVVVGG